MAYASAVLGLQQGFAFITAVVMRSPLILDVYLLAANLWRPDDALALGLCMVLLLRVRLLLRQTAVDGIP